jgi:hypothetical protein
MEKENLIKLSNRFKKLVHPDYVSSSSLFKLLNKDKVFKSLPLSVKDRVYISFLITNSKYTNDLSKLYDKIEGALFKSTMTVIEMKDAEAPCDVCDGAGRYNCEECDGRGDVECSECNGYGEVYDLNPYPEICTTCRGNEVEECHSCEGESLINCEECFGEGEVEVGGSAMVSTLSLYSFNPQIFNSLELINGSNNNVLNDDIYDEILKDKLSCITYLEYEDYEFIESDFEWAEEGQIILDSLSLI